MLSVNKRFVWPVRVYYEDTDSGGVVYYANYLKFFERARTEWLRALGFEQDALLAEHGILFAVAGVEIRYRRPARFNDQLYVTASVMEAGKSKVVFGQSIHRGASDGELVADGIVRVACLQADTFRPCAMPQAILQELES